MKTINQAFQKGKETVTLYKYDLKKQICLNFDQLTQRKVASGTIQKLICGIAINGECFTWLWDDEKSYHCFRPGLVLRIEVAYRLKHKKVKFFLNDDYELNLETMTQVNINSGHCRAVRREQMFDSNLVYSFQSSMNQVQKILADAVNLSPDVIHFELPPSCQRKLISLKRKSEIDAQLQPASKKKSLVPVDPECAEKNNYHVYTEGCIVYHATLNQTNLQNNANMFFIIQLLKHDKKKEFLVYFRWGRVGTKGRNSLVTKCGSNLAEAKSVFEKKFYVKTRNKLRNAVDGNFVKVDGKFDFLQIDLNPGVEKKMQNVEPVEPKLDKKIQSLLELIGDKKVMEKIMEEMFYNSKQTPLGKLTSEQIKDGYAALRDVAAAINLNKKESELVKACNQFYTKIPHDFGMRIPPILQTRDDVAAKINMLEALENITVAMDVMDENSLENVYPLGKYYKSLQCYLDVIQHSDEKFKILEAVLNNTHGPTHYQKLKVIEAYKCYKESEHKNFKNYGNCLLLWHGSQLCNWISILKKGLQIPSSEVPSNGSMFGKGIYFADSCTKSANYCNMYRNRDGILLLSEVSVGNPLKVRYKSNIPEKMRKSYNSIQGIGKYQPSSVQKTVLSPDADTIFGPLVADKSEEFYSLYYNEYVVYDANQVKLKYLLRVRNDK